MFQGGILWPGLMTARRLVVSICCSCREGHQAKANVDRQRTSDLLRRRRFERLANDHKILPSTWNFNVPCPILVGRFKTTASVTMFESPPSSEAGKLPTSQAIGLAMRCNGCQEIEKVKDDFGPSV